MKNLNDLIWNPEDEGSVDPAGIGGDGDNMDDICMTGFCFDTALPIVQCDPVQGTFVCTGIGDG